MSLEPGDWPRWRALRLAALAEAPYAFGSILPEWTGDSDTDERWRNRWVGVPHNLVIVLAGHDVGMVGLAPPDGEDLPELLRMVHQA